MASIDMRKPTRCPFASLKIKRHKTPSILKILLLIERRPCGILEKPAPSNSLKAPLSLGPRTQYRNPLELGYGQISLYVALVLELVEAPGTIIGALQLPHLWCPAPFCPLSTESARHLFSRCHPAILLPLSLLLHARYWRYMSAQGTVLTVSELPIDGGVFRNLAPAIY